MKYTLDMDFSALEGTKAVNWVNRFRDMLEDTFSGSDSRPYRLSSPAGGIQEPPHSA